MLKRIAVAAAATFFLAGPALADITVTPVDVTATNTFPFFGEYKPENLINGSGLTGGLHDANYANMWMTDLGVAAATLTFDLGGFSPCRTSRSGTTTWAWRRRSPRRSIGARRRSSSPSRRTE
jgi:hypothetical protein